LSCYTGFRPKVPTLQHKLKFRASVEGSFDPHPDFSKDLAVHAVNKLGLLSLGSTTPLILYQGHPGKRSPGLEQSCPQDDFLERELDWIGANQDHREFVSVYFEAYSPVLQGLEFACQIPDWSARQPSATYHHIEEFSFHSSYGHPPWAGKVVPLNKDGGWKVRWIASPFRIHQLALKPLGDALFKRLNDLPWDCTFKQEKPISKIQDCLNQGRVAYAVDLSAATDHFPLSIQEDVLRAICPKTVYVDLFRDLSRGLWGSPIGPVRWTKGQPMGLYPSFASFALSHGILLHWLNGGIHDDEFFILGDDVVILKDSLYQKYIETLDILGCPYDPGKSFISPDLTEFAGKVITRNSVYPKFKIGTPDSHEDSFMELIRTYGQGFRFFLPTRLRKVYETVGHLMPPWGANHSQGLARSLEVVTEETLDFEDLATETKGGRLHVSFLKLLTDRLKPERKESLWNRLAMSVSSLSEQFERTVKKAESSVKVPLIHEDLTDVFELTDIPSGLPSVGSRYDESHRTFYHVLKDMIKRSKAKKM
jgi:hypothetical protein